MKKDGFVMMLINMFSQRNMMVDLGLNQVNNQFRGDVSGNKFKATQRKERAISRRKKMKTCAR